MSKQLIRKESASDIVGWLESLRGKTSEYRHPEHLEREYLGNVFSEKMALQKNFVIVPMPELWVPTETGDKIFSFLQSRKYSRLYGVGLLYEEELHLSVPVDAVSIKQMIHKFWSYCLLAPRDEEFLILHTNFQYWLLAGPLSLVEEMIGTSIDNAFDNFVKVVSEGGDDEPGPDFAADIVARYRHHNQLVLAATV